ncbi:helix-turn-helix domain-containing protein [Flavobacterium sp.]|uniref:helix-turn-helix domain-containing protein n=1 Tax=Flavobacterium sp. TaxID=239 RepID=UPI00260F4BB2|nr:helix-turn-helix domain-containing protein [Flavobacterium sp.]
MKYNRVQFPLQILLFFALVFSNVIVAQKSLKQETLFDECEALIYSKPNDALKIGFHILKTSTSNSDRAKINLLIAKVYRFKGDHSNSLNYLFEASKNKTDLPPALAIDIAFNKAAILRKLYIDDQSNKYIKEAEEKISELKDKKEYSYAKGLITLERSLMYLDRQNYKAAFKLIEQDSVEKKYPELNLWFALTKGRIYCGLGDFENAQLYLDKGIELINKSVPRNTFAEIYTLSGLATVYFHKKEHDKAIAALLKALKSAKMFGNLYLIETINNQLIVNYIAINDRGNYKLSNTAFLAASKKVEDIEQESINTAYNLISKGYEKDYDIKKQHYATRLYILLSILVLGVFFTVFFWFKFQSKKKRLREIINYLEITRNNLISRFTEKKDTGKKIAIPQETEQVLLNKLKRFESSKRYTNNDMSLAVLAGQFETNTKYLSEVINKHYNVNFNTYINKLRIGFIVEKLKSDSNFMNYKISYLAETCGFSSHSSFATVFKSITGIAPITFIELLKDEKEAIHSN